MWWRRRTRVELPWKHTRYSILFPYIYKIPGSVSNTKMRWSIRHFDDYQLSLQVKNHMWIFVNSLIENPTFDSQTKENMTLQAKSFGSTCQLSEKFIKAVSTYMESKIEMSYLISHCPQLLHYTSSDLFSLCFVVFIAGSSFVARAGL